MKVPVGTQAVVLEPTRGAATGSSQLTDIWRSQPDDDTLIRVMFPFGYRDESPYLQSNPGNWTVAVRHANVADTLCR